MRSSIIVPLVCVALHAGGEGTTIGANSQTRVSEGCAGSGCPAWLAWGPGQRETQVPALILTWCSSWPQENCPFSRGGDVWWSQICRGISCSQLKSRVPSLVCLVCPSVKPVCVLKAVHLPGSEQRAPAFGSWWQGSSRGFTGFHAPPVILGKDQRGTLWSTTRYYLLKIVMICDPKVIDIVEWSELWTGERKVYPHLWLPFLFYLI